MKQILFILFIISSVSLSAQPSTLKPGFDAKEYADLLSLTFFSSSIPDSIERTKREDPYTMLYRSSEVGLFNRWTLYIRKDNVAVIDLRGTTADGPSWLENFYAATIAAKGYLQLNDSTRFEYQLAESPEAQVHIGWTIGLAHLGPDILQKINELFANKKTTDFIIMGHSQGGALSFLLRSWLEYEQRKGTIPASIHFKTYSSAAPKPGNLQYAYDYDFITRGGWSLTVVNAADWVPETPFSIQTLNDFNPSNPFVNAKKAIKKQKLITRIVLKNIYNKLDKPTRKAQRRFEKYLGRGIYSQVRKTLPGLQKPSYTPGNNYMRAGTPIVLLPDAAYQQEFPDSPNTPFIHHTYKSYFTLLKTIYPEAIKP